jgi:hypothetical protein
VFYVFHVFHVFHVNLRYIFLFLLYDCLLIQVKIVLLCARLEGHAYHN